MSRCSFTILVALVLSLAVVCTVVPPASSSGQHRPNSILANRDENLLEIGKASRTHTHKYPEPGIRVLSYNIRWRGGEELKQLINLFRTDQEIGGASILALQEVDRSRKRTGKTNTGKLIAEDLGLNYAWAAPPAAPSSREEETGVAIMSTYPLSEIRRIVLPHPGPGKRRRVALGATIAIGKTKLRVYSVHSETRIAVSKKMEQLQAVLADLEQHPKQMPAIVMGDFNTWEPGAVDATEELFQKAGFATPFDERSTFCRDLVLFDLKLKLDWIWLRGLETTAHGIDRAVKISDHWPLWTVIRNPDKQAS